MIRCIYTSAASDDVDRDRLTNARLALWKFIDIATWQQLELERHSRMFIKQAFISEHTRTRAHAHAHAVLRAYRCRADTVYHIGPVFIIIIIILLKRFTFFNFIDSFRLLNIHIII